MNTKVRERVEALRQLMRREHLSAFIIPSTDPHNSEYVADHWKGREWISGFNGSAGTAVITLTSAAIWTDSRYFLAAEEQLAGTGFELQKLKIEGTPTIAQWLQRDMQEASTCGSSAYEVGIDGMTNCCTDVENLIHELRQCGGMTLRTNLDPLREIWTDRPGLPLHPIQIHDLEYAGEEVKSKLQRIRKSLRQRHCDGMLVSSLDDIAWTLNLRGNDVHCNPVFIAYLLISTDKATLFTDSRKLTTEVKAYLHANNIDTMEYKDVKQGLAKYNEYNILIDPNEVNYTLSKALKCPEVVRGQSPIPVMKAVKNEAEQRGFKSAMLRDGVAMTKFLCWLDEAVKQGGETELSVDRKLTALRAELPLFRGLSFDTIAAYEEHGAIVHYEATEETNVTLQPKGFLLLDSGAQYLDGTTDITRTIPLGPLTDEQRKVYTLVLKGHIDLELAKFPDGASGTQIDAIARQALWREGLNFLHGTGHGVGSYLNVHEGPHQIRMEWKPTPLRAGMTVTDEPGIYLAGRFGVRIENTLIIKEYKETELGRFLQMESLTLCPISTSPIIRELLNDEEISWLNQYHERCRRLLSPHLSEEEQAWLENATQPLT